MSDAVNIFVAAISAGNMLLFSVEYCRQRCGWELLWIVCIEFLYYTLALALPAELLPSFTGPEGDRDMPLSRYMCWMLTCPILIKVMLHTVSPKPNIEKQNKAILADILMNACGFIACMYTDGRVVMAFFIVGCVCAAFVVRCVFTEWAKHRADMDQPGRRKLLMLLMVISWTLFPLLFLLGPEGFGVWTRAISDMGHGIGDLFAKNIFGVIAYKIKVQSDALKAANATMEKEKMVQEAVEAGEVKVDIMPENEKPDALPIFEATNMAPQKTATTGPQFLSLSKESLQKVAQNPEGEQLAEQMSDQAQKMFKLKADMASMMHKQKQELKAEQKLRAEKEKLKAEKEKRRESRSSQQKSPRSGQHSLHRSPRSGQHSLKSPKSPSQRRVSRSPALRSQKLEDSKSPTQRQQKLRSPVQRQQKLKVPAGLPRSPQL